jgi:ubiquinone/menaquinone biosynthesis C-methylase UbiE
VLDVGCGTGVHFPFIEERIGEGGRIMAVDSAPAMIARARELHAGHGNIEYMTAFIEDARLADGAFDVILCYAVLPHLDDIPAALGQLRKALSPDGTMYIFHPDDTRTLNEFHGSLKAPVRHDVLPGEGDLRLMLEEAGFRVLRYIDRPGLNFVESAP